MIDSQSLSWFRRTGIDDKGFKKFVLNKNIKAIWATTRQMINTNLLDYVKHRNIEKGRKFRIDCNCVDANIHHPTDSSLLWDALRVFDPIDGGIIQRKQ